MPHRTHCTHCTHWHGACRTALTDMPRFYSLACCTYTTHPRPLSLQPPPVLAEVCRARAFTPLTLTPAHTCARRP
eukprot:3713495-Prymnesium_polylepis.1